MGISVTPAVAVVVPVLDEERTIESCIRAIGQQDIGSHRLEVLVVDGGSRDRTVEVARGALTRERFARADVAYSRDGSRSGNLNAGLAKATAPVLCRVDARSRIPAHYARRCLEILDQRADVSVVGGRQRAVAPGVGAVQVGIARALNNRWATGGSRYRRGGKSGPSDTVYLGAFRTEQLRAAGGWRATLAMNEDYDLNRRMGERGVIWFDASLVVDYLPRDTLRAVWEQYVRFGRWKARYWRRTGDWPQPRQVALLSVPVVAAGGLLCLVATASSRRRTAVLLAGSATVAAVEILGGPTSFAVPMRDNEATDQRRSDCARAHLAAVAAIACMAGGWLGGAWLELIRGSGSVPRWRGHG